MFDADPDKFPAKCYLLKRKSYTLFSPVLALPPLYITVFKTIVADKEIFFFLVDFIFLSFSCQLLCPRVYDRNCCVHLYLSLSLSLSLSLHLVCHEFRPYFTVFFLLYLFSRCICMIMDMYVRWSRTNR